MTISFKQLKNPMTGELSDRYIQYTDERGTAWTVPLGDGHRFEDIYNDWLADGNTPEPAD